MTTITIINWLLIIFVMAVTYDRDVAPQVPQNLKFSAVFIPTLHLLTGLTAQLLATYLVIRMWFEKRLPARPVAADSRIGSDYLGRLLSQLFVQPTHG